MATFEISNNLSNSTTYERKEPYREKRHQETGRYKKPFSFILHVTRWQRSTTPNSNHRHDSSNAQYYFLYPPQI